MNAISASSSTVFDKNQRISINKITTLIAKLRKIDIGMVLGEALFFLVVSQNEGKSLKEIAERCDLLIPTASRYLDHLMYVAGSKPNAGVSLLHAIDNPMNRRQKIITLTVAGRKLIEGLIEGI